ncbi:MAG: kelch repeat-containing protein [Pseudomonadota bacterium]
MTRFDRRAFLCGTGSLAALTLPSSVLAHDTPKPIGSWTPLADMPFPVQEIYPAPFRKTDPASVKSLKPSAYNIIVNAGGLTPFGDNNVSNEVTYYDPVLNEWNFGSSLPEPRHHIALTPNNGFLFAYGGFARDARGGWQMRTDCWRTNDIHGVWSRATSLPHPQAEFAAASLGGFIHIAGGRAPSGSRNLDWSDHIDTDEHWIYDPAAQRWVALAPLPTARNSSAGVVFNGVFYVIGGRTVSGGNSPAVEVYDPLSDRWEKARPMPKAQGGLAAAALGDKIYVFGGEYFSPGDGGVFADAWEYDPRTDQWRSIAAMPRPRHGLGAVHLGGSIYVIGGAAKVGGSETTAALDKFEI